MSISVQGVCYTHPDKETLFRNIHFTVNKGQKAALIGNNGSGKSTLLQIIAGRLSPSEGKISTSSPPYYVPQHFGQYDRQTLAQALRIEEKLTALHAILDGDASTENFTLLDDDWNVEERSFAALSHWGLGHVSLNRPMHTLSGGEKSKVFLAGIRIHEPGIVLMDEPTNHLDTGSRLQLYAYIESTPATLLVVSHDRTLLNKLTCLFELNKNELVAYGGNYDFFEEQKERHLKAIQASLDEKEKELRQAKKTAREAAERKQREDARGKKQNEKKGVARIMMRTLKDKAEKSATRLKDTHTGKMEELKGEIKQIQNGLPENRLLKADFASSSLHTGKNLITATGIEFRHEEANLWKQPLTFRIRSGDRLSVNGQNGSGKTTLLKLITGELEPQEGILERAVFSHVFIDQEYTVIQPSRTVLEQVERFNSSCFPEHELKTLLNRFLFPYGTWNNTCDKLSGGEKMRLMLCCLFTGNKTPDMILLDEPTNNLDIRSVAILTSVIKEYRGTVVAVSHDAYFTREIGIDRSIEL